jgi:hypothetical protein
MAEGRISPNEFLSGLGDQAKNHDPGHKSQGQIWTRLGQRKRVSSQSLPSE